MSPRPILQFEKTASLLITGQAPGLAAHESGIPWNDASGARLRAWLGMEESVFYDPGKVAIVPIGFCYPGKSKGGDLPPRPECQKLWMAKILDYIENIRFKVVIGSHSASYFCGRKNLSHYIKEHALNDSSFIVLPHPSPRNNIWLAKNKWFEQEYLPVIKDKLWRGVRFSED